jgi:uridine kinase
MVDSAAFKSLVARIQTTQSALPRSIIAIDGRGGAGKSSLARAITAAISGAIHIEYDWFHLPQAEISNSAHRFDYRRLIQEVIEPFRGGARAFEIRRYNWGYLSGKVDGFADEPVRLQEVEMIVVEGCGILNPVLSNLFDLKIWTDTSAEESLARGIRRDIHEYGLEPEKVQSAWDEWSRWEAAALLQDNRRLRADIIM